jgi:hypothetical protein
MFGASLANTSLLPVRGVKQTSYQQFLNELMLSTSNPTLANAGAAVGRVDLRRGLGAAGAGRRRNRRIDQLRRFERGLHSRP